MRYQQSKFKYQLKIVKNAICDKFIVLGDFNLDYSLKNDVDCRYANMYNDFDSMFDNVNLIRIIMLHYLTRALKMRLIL